MVTKAEKVKIRGLKRVKTRERRNAYNRKYRQNIINQIHYYLGEKCENCGSVENLQIHHVRLWGDKHRCSFSSENAYLRSILNEISAGSHDYILLCNSDSCHKSGEVILKFLEEKLN